MLECIGNDKRDMKRSQPFSTSSAKFESCLKLEAVEYSHYLFLRRKELKNESLFKQCTLKNTWTHKYICMIQFIRDSVNFINDHVVI